MRAMHEMSLAQNVVDCIEDAARREPFRRARVVRLAIGQLACVEPGALALAFEAAALGTCAEGARLLLETIPGWGQCPRCGHQDAQETLYDLCPTCGTAPLRPLRGTDMRVRDLEVD